MKTIDNLLAHQKTKPLPEKLYDFDKNWEDTVKEVFAPFPGERESPRMYFSKKGYELFQKALKEEYMKK